MTIRNRTNPPRQRPRKDAGVYGTGMGIQTIGTNPPSLDEPAYPRFPRQPGTPVPVIPPTAPVPVTPAPTPAPAPAPGTPLPPTPSPYPEPVTPPTTPAPPGGPVTPPVSGTPTLPTVPGVPPTPTPYPEPVTGLPPPGSGAPPPGQVGVVPPGYGLDFVREITPNELVANQLNSLLSSNSAYMQNARQRGLEVANARGNLNSSIAAGASQRAALEAALPIAQSDAQAYREANAANFDSLAQLRQMRTAAQLEDWLNDSTYTREYNGRLAMMPIQSSMDMMAFIAQRAAEDPAVWTPDVMSGWMNFFNMWQSDIFSTLLGDPEGGE
jgi:hypothetical protein